MPQDEKWPDKKKYDVGARRIGNKGPSGAQGRIRNRSRGARGGTCRLRSLTPLGFVLETHFFVLENQIFPLTRADQALTREQHNPVCGPTVEILALSKTAFDALGSLKGLMDTRMLTCAD